MCVGGGGGLSVCLSVMVFRVRPQSLIGDGASFIFLYMWALSLLLVGDGASFIFLHMWALSRLRPRAWSHDHSLLPPSLSASRPGESRESTLFSDIFALSVTSCMS